MVGTIRTEKTKGDEINVAEKFVKQIEDMTDAQVKERIETAMSAKLPSIRAIPYVGDKELVDYKTEELVARCPMTGLPDLYTLLIQFIPNKQIPELKSLKQYFNAYVDLPISHEHLLSKIHREFSEAIKPEVCSMELQVAVRGGIKTTVRIPCEVQVKEVE